MIYRRIEKEVGSILESEINRIEEEVKVGRKKVG